MRFGMAGTALRDYRGRRFEDSDSHGRHGTGESRDGEDRGKVPGGNRHSALEEGRIGVREEERGGGQTVERGEARGEGKGCGSRRYFGRGGVKYALLELLTMEPMHGYQMMKALEEQSGGLYIASAGSIYPTLQLLEDRGFIVSEENEGRKVYRITDAGRGFLAEKPEGEERGGRGRGPGTEEPDDPEWAKWRRERFRLKLGLSEAGYEVLRKLIASERAAEAEGNGALRKELARLVEGLDRQLAGYLNSFAAENKGSGGEGER